MARPKRRSRKGGGKDLKWKLLSLIMLIAIGAMGVYWWRTVGSLRDRPAPGPKPAANRVDPDRSAFLNLTLYFSNSREDPETLRCSQVYPVSRRIPATDRVAFAALHELLEGPTAAEAEVGYYSNLNPGTRLLSLDLAAGIATVDFSDEFSAGVSGSCRVEAIRAQIQETLRQFETVHEVRIRVEGKETGVLQP